MKAHWTKGLKSHLSSRCLGRYILAHATWPNRQGCSFTLVRKAVSRCGKSLSDLNHNDRRPSRKKKKMANIFEWGHSAASSGKEKKKKQKAGNWTQPYLRQPGEPRLNWRHRRLTVGARLFCRFTEEGEMRGVRKGQEKWQAGPCCAHPHPREHSPYTQNPQATLLSWLLPYMGKLSHSTVWAFGLFLV